jgi:CRISPR/Cas system CMR subunit Cmr4 (Cas7 group RAMP superfamily)
MHKKYSEYDILLIMTITNLCERSGNEGENADLSIQRASYGFPPIYSLSLKGAVKNYIYGKGGKQFAELFFESGEKEDFTSPTASTGTYLLAFIVRSLEGAYCYLTCRILLKRFKEYSNIAEYELDNNVKSLVVKGA